MPLNASNDILFSVHRTISNLIYRSCVVFIALIACEDPFLSSMKSIEYLVDIPIDY